MSACQLCHYEVKGNGAKNNVKAKYSYNMANESQVKIWMDMQIVSGF